MSKNNESPAALLPTIDELTKRQAHDDPVFAAWRDSVPDKHWCKLDLSALRIGYELGRAIASTAPAASDSRGSVPVGYAVLPREATDEMQDAVRYLLVGLEQPGRTYGSVRKHCERSGMDVSHWPAWTRENDEAHFTKAACAAILWHCMQHVAAPTPPAVASGEPTAALPSRFFYSRFFYEAALELAHKHASMSRDEFRKACEQRARELARSAAAKENT